MLLRFHFICLQEKRHLFIPPSLPARCFQVSERFHHQYLCDIKIENVWSNFNRINVLLLPLNALTECKFWWGILKDSCHKDAHFNICVKEQKEESSYTWGYPGCQSSICCLVGITYWSIFCSWSLSNSKSACRVFSRRRYRRKRKLGYVLKWKKSFQYQTKRCV